MAPTYGDAQVPLQPGELREALTLLGRQVDARLLEVVAQGTPHAHRLRTVPISRCCVSSLPMLRICSGAPCCLLRMLLLQGGCSLVALQGAHQLAVQALMRVEMLHISCVSSTLFRFSCTPVASQTAQVERMDAAACGKAAPPSVMQALVAALFHVSQVCTLRQNSAVS